MMKTSIWDNEKQNKHSDISFFLFHKWISHAFNKLYAKYWTHGQYLVAYVLKMECKVSKGAKIKNRYNQVPSNTQIACLVLL